MAEVLHAMGIAAAILLPVVLLILAASIKAVKRGEASMGHGDAHHAEATHAAPAAAAKSTGDKLIPRRSMISWMTLAWAAFSASMLAAATATGRFMFPNVLFEPPPTFKAGSPDELQKGIVDERFKQRFGVWLVKDNDVVTGALGIYALSTVCTHWAALPTGSTASRNSSARATAAVITKTELILKVPPRGLWNDMPSLWPTTARSWWIRVTSSSMKRASGSIHNPF
jgi:cytochrome b6-f complex iron-sulfur subunit